MNQPAPLIPRWGRPLPPIGPLHEAGAWLGRIYLALAGWRVRGDWPVLPKAVLVAAPHTSNWDGIFMLAAAAHYRIRLQWMGKASLVAGPFGWLIKALGCVPVHREARHDLVGAMRAAFDARPNLLLLVPPEGTRSLTRAWKSGFYHIARTAGVPLIISIMDYGTKTITIAGVFEPTGDYAADLPVIQGYYRGATGKHEDRFVVGNERQQPD